MAIEKGFYLNCLVLKLLCLTFLLSFLSRSSMPIQPFNPITSGINPGMSH
uniref:Uncharacterized protein n=1 Tax=Picea glauca TaxID=3330 RepID=A0A101M042_PICGL|nr:hypothetical protein ABT39_MTgene4581 [Picea glauca]QHR88164.1 hypothetical protein Q903MT_gene2177 [Picea sitchensis]